MPPRLSHNLPRLKVAANNIVNAETQQAFVLRGVNVSGLEYSCPDCVACPADAFVDEAALLEIVCNWKANIIRVPFNQEWALERPGYDPRPYRNALERTIYIAAAAGAYTLLDLHWLDDRTPRGTINGRPNFVPPLPDLDSIRVWRQLAELWREETAVLYDLFNEPHDVLPDDSIPVSRIRDDGSTYVLRSRKVRHREWRPWARHLIQAIRSRNPDALIFVSGTDWGFDLRNCVMPDIPGLVYSTHVYPWKPDNWDCAFGDLAGAVPVFAGEWGGGDCDVGWGLRLAAFFEDRGIGWTAWSWSDEPRLITCAQRGSFEPTRFGAFVRGLLQSKRC
ncbi:MAG: cellulase family glycosylhydrolase [Acidobacteriaceae bacterium]|nr:cellulase family glycosylhydrolase [Acidobacteriaceae bacterium]